MSFSSLVNGYVVACEIEGSPCPEEPPFFVAMAKIQKRTRTCSVWGINFF
jgi:hypothetical protein